MLNGYDVSTGIGAWCPLVRRACPTTRTRSWSFLLLLVATFSFVSGCAYVPRYEPFPEDAWLIAYWSSGGPAPVLSAVAVYPDGRIVARDSTPDLLETRIDAQERTVLREAVDALKRSAVDLFSYSDRSVCCDVEAIAVEGEVAFSFSCQEDHPDPEAPIVDLVEDLQRITDAHFDGIRVRCAAWDRRPRSDRATGLDPD